MSARKDMVVFVGVLVCLVVAANADADTGTVNELEATATAVDISPPYGCRDISLSPSDKMIATVAVEQFINGMCGEQYSVTCNSNGSRDSIGVDPCNPDKNQVTVTIVGFCEDCTTFLQLSLEAYDVIAPRKLSSLRILYKPARMTAINS